MLWFLRHTPNNTDAPADVDTVVCSATDVMLESITMTYAFVVPAPLDVTKLRESLFTVIVNKLPRAGARLAKRNGLFEFQIPQTFSAAVPPAGFTSITHNAPFPHEKHKIPPRMPTDATAPLVTDFSGQDAIRLFRGPGTPQDTKAFLEPNTPAIHVHVAAYDDTTLLGITASHMMIDIEGVATLCKYWLASLHGQDQLDALPSAPRINTPLEKIAEEHVVSGRHFQPSGQPFRGLYVLSWWSTLKLAVLFAWRLFSESFIEQTRLIWIPAAWLEKRKEECMASLKQNNSEDWVGSNDVLTAYIYKTIYVGRTDSAPINIHTLLNLRRILPSDFTHPYLHNNLTGVVVPEVPAHQLGAQPLHLTALALRRSLIAFTDNLDTFRSELVWLRQFRGRTPPLLPNLPGGEIALISNWRSARLNKMNWSVAKTRGDGAEAKPTFVFLGMQDGRILPSRGTGQIMSESKEGIWGDGLLPPSEGVSSHAHEVRSPA